MISDRKDTEGVPLLPGLRYELFAEYGLFFSGSVVGVWTGDAFLDDMTGEVVDHEAHGYASAMLLPPEIRNPQVHRAA